MARQLRVSSGTSTHHVKFTTFYPCPSNAVYLFARPTSTRFFCLPCTTSRLRCFPQHSDQVFSFTRFECRSSIGGRTPNVNEPWLCSPTQQLLSVSYLCLTPTCTYSGASVRCTSKCVHRWCARWSVLTYLLCFDLRGELGSLLLQPLPLSLFLRALLRRQGCRLPQHVEVAVRPFFSPISHCLFYSFHTYRTRAPHTHDPIRKQYRHPYTTRAT